MSKSNICAENRTNLDVDNTNIALMVIQKELVELERLCDLESDKSKKLDLLAKHRELLDLYQSIIQQQLEDYNPYRTPYDW